jgi:hypothetical protein
MAVVPAVTGPAVVGSRPLPILSSRAGVLWDGLTAVYAMLGFDQAAGRDAVVQLLVLARIIEPTSKQDSLRVLAEVGVDLVPSYATLKRRLKAWAKDGFRQELAKACAAHAGLGPASLVLYDASTLYFETDTGDGFREPGYSNYAVLSIMPRWVSRRWCSCWSVGSAGMARAA